MRLTRRDALKYGAGSLTSLFLPSILNADENHLHIEIRNEYRKDPKNAFAIHHLDTIWNIVKNEDIEFEYLFYEQTDGWCIKFHNKKVRTNIKYEPSAIYDMEWLDATKGISVKMKNIDNTNYDYGMVLDKIENFERPKNRLINTAIHWDDWDQHNYIHRPNLQVVEYQGLINGLEIV